MSPGIFPAPSITVRRPGGRPSHPIYPPRELAPFARRVEREAKRRGFDRAKRQVVVGDGARWIWGIVDEIFPDAIRILDRWHAKEHLSDVAKAIFGATSDLAKPWTERRWAEMDRGDVDALQTAYREHAGRCEEARQCVGYLEAHRKRMDYPRFKAMGLDWVE